MRRRARVAAAALTAAVAAGGAGPAPSAAAQTPPVVPDSAAAPADTTAPSRPTLEGVAVLPRSRGTLVATAIVVPVGSAADPTGGPGTAAALAEVMAAGARRRLPPAAEVGVVVDRDWTAFTLLVPRERWRDALATLTSSLFREPVPGDLVAPVLADLMARFRFEAGAPVREFEQELYGVLTSAAHPWARPPRGDPAVVGSLGSGALESFRRTHWERGAARVGVVGPLDPVEARAAVAAAGLGGRPAAPRPASDDRAWDDGRRVLLEREVTNAWIGVLFPAPRDVSRTLLEAVAHRITEELNPSPPAPGVFAATARVEEAPDGPVLVVEAAVFPESAATWERRIVELVDAMDEPVQPSFFRWQRRRFRSWRLLQEAAPEDEARRVALDLLRLGRVRDLPAEIWALTPTAVAEAADDLGEPRIVVLGPELSARFR